MSDAYQWAFVPASRPHSSVLVKGTDRLLHVSTLPTLGAAEFLSIGDTFLLFDHTAVWTALYGVWSKEYVM